MDFRYEGGSIRSFRDYQNVASVEYVLRKQGESKWRIYLKGVPLKNNYEKGESLIYNTKGTSNSNADNQMTVLEVGGPGYYICQGPERLNV